MQLTTRQHTVNHAWLDLLPQFFELDIIDIFDSTSAVILGSADRWLVVVGLLQLEEIVSLYQIVVTLYFPK